MQHFEYEDLSVAFERAGSGLPILFLHNGGTSHHIWREQFRSLSTASRSTTSPEMEGLYDTIAVDLPGFGESPLGIEPMDLDRYVQVIASLITNEIGGPTAIVGNCMGANIAFELARRQPEAVEALILVNPLTEATFSAGGIGLLHKLDRLAPPVAALSRRVSRHFVLPRFGARLALRFQLGRIGSARQIQRDRDLVACNTRKDQLPALVDILEDMSAYGRMDREAEPLAIPVCTVWGSQNRVLSVAEGRNLNERLRPDRSAVFPGCGHLVMLESPEEVTILIRDFLKEHGYASGQAPNATAQPSHTLSDKRS